MAADNTFDNLFLAFLDVNNGMSFSNKSIWVTGILPTVCTAKEAITVPNAEACINVEPEQSPTERAAKSESPAPATSIGLELRAGKCCLLKKPSASKAYAIKPSEAG